MEEFLQKKIWSKVPFLWVPKYQPQPPIMLLDLLNVETQKLG